MSVSKHASIAAQAEEIESSLSAIRRALRRPLEAEVARGQLTVPQTAVMRVVVREPGISLKDLSGAINLAHSTVSGIADRLEKRGFIERRLDDADRRIARIYPTAAVADFVRERIPALRTGPLQAALNRAEPAEREELIRAFRRLRDLLEQI